MIDVKCHVQCGLPTITNPCGLRQVDESIETKKKEVAADLGRSIVRYGGTRYG